MAWAPFNFIDPLKDEIMIKSIPFLLAFFLIMGLIGNEDMKEQERIEKRYCEMVEMYKESNGDTGWPPYKGECK